MDFQDDSFKIIEIIKICNQIIDIRSNNITENSNLDILSKNIDILSVFNSLDPFDIIKIKIGLNVTKIDILSYNINKETNFGIIIDLILKSWINLTIDDKILSVSLPLYIKQNLEKYFLSTPIGKREIISKFMKTINFENTLSIIPKLLVNNNIIDDIEKIYNKDIKLIKNIIIDMNKIKIRYRNNILILNNNNLIDNNRKNNWMISYVNTRKRAYSANKIKDKFIQKYYPKIQTINQELSNNIRYINEILAKNDINKIYEMINNTKINFEYIISWFRNGYPSHYLDVYNFVKNYYNHAGISTVFLDKNITFNNNNKITSDIDVLIDIIKTKYRSNNNLIN